MKKIAIIGGGVAGLSAAIYALRSGAEVTLFEQFGLGGLVATIDKIENFPSYASVEGWKLASDMSAQAKSLGVKTVRQKVLSLCRQGENFVVVTDKAQYEFPAVVVATGTSHNKLGIEGDLVGHGVSYCATCDGAFFRGKSVAVVGGGRVTVSEATYLADICAEVFVITTQTELTAEDKATQSLLSRSNVKPVYNTTVSQILSVDGEVSGVKLFCNGVTSQLDVAAVFVATGAQPVTDFVDIEGVQKVRGYLVVDGKGETSVKGLFAAGDVTNGSLKQIVTACADGAKAGAFASAYSATVK